MINASIAQGSRPCPDQLSIDRVGKYVRIYSRDAPNHVHEPDTVQILVVDKVQRGLNCF